MPNQTQPSEELRIEAIRWHQKLQEIIYLEAGQHMRALNQLHVADPKLRDCC